MVNSTHETHKDQINLYRSRSKSSRMSNSTRKKTPHCIDSDFFSPRMTNTNFIRMLQPNKKHIYTILVLLNSSTFGETVFKCLYISFPRSCVFLVPHVAGYGTGIVVIAGPDVSNNIVVWEILYVWITVANTTQIQTFFVLSWMLYIFNVLKINIISWIQVYFHSFQYL